jgi:glutamate synthase (NADPH/NADH) small chain
VNDSRLTPAERMSIPRQEMPVQPPSERRANFSEVALGFTTDLAIAEAQRCLQCKRPSCVEGCPVGVPIPEFIGCIRDGKTQMAVQLMKTKNNLPAICGRVCPQEVQCEAKCVLARTGEPVAIGRLERFVGDYELENRTCPLTKGLATGKSIAVVGSGPASLTCAVDLALLGHDVTVFESLHQPGGVLTYGIPEFRLPKGVVNAEIEYAARCLGIEIRCDVVIGRLYTVDDLLTEEGFDAVFLGTGAGLPTFLKVEGINLSGVLSANEFLTRVNLMKGYLFPQYDTPVKAARRVAVIGAGNVAMDAARCSLRLQALRLPKSTQPAPEVHIVYRRSRAEVPARAEEVEHAEQEGIQFDFLTSPVMIHGDESGQVRGMRCIRMELGEPDSSGRPRPIPIQGSEFDLELDRVILALGTRPNPLVFGGAVGLEMTQHGTVIASEDTGRTLKPHVWAGGDVVTGAATVISAMGAGKRAAVDIHQYLASGSQTWNQAS